MRKQIWYFDFTSYWGDFRYSKGTGIVILGIHLYRDDIGIILFNFGFRVVKY